MPHSKYLSKFQLGKNGLTDGVINSLIQDLKNHKQVRVSVLKSCCRDKQELCNLANKIISKIPYKLSHKIIGYTIVLIKLK